MVRGRDYIEWWERRDKGHHSWLAKAVHPSCLEGHPLIHVMMAVHVTLTNCPSIVQVIMWTRYTGRWCLYIYLGLLSAVAMVVLWHISHPFTWTPLTIMRTMWLRVGMYIFRHSFMCVCVYHSTVSVGNRNWGPFNHRSFALTTGLLQLLWQPIFRHLHCTIPTRLGTYID